MAAARLAIVIDYQNIHLTATDRFAPYGTQHHETLVHPLHFAEQAVAGWSEKYGEAELAQVLVFRGAPSNARQPTQYSVVQRQRSEWTRDRRVKVNYRTIRYSDRPGIPPREKGVDVLVALHLVKLSTAEDLDVVLLAAHDTDQEPALEMAVREGTVRVGTVGWDRCKRLRVPGADVPHVSLDGSAFVRSRDRRVYLQPPTR